MLGFGRQFFKVPNTDSRIAANCASFDHLVERAALLGRVTLHGLDQGWGSGRGIEPWNPGCSRQLRRDARSFAECGVPYRNRMSRAGLQLHVHAVRNMTVVVVCDRSNGTAFIERAVNDLALPAAERSVGYPQPSLIEIKFGGPLAGDRQKQDGRKEDERDDQTGRVPWLRDCPQVASCGGHDRKDGKKAEQDNCSEHGFA